MPMVLRSRKSTRAPTKEHSDSDLEEDIPRSAQPPQRKFTRLHGRRVIYEDGQDSDSEPGQNFGLESREEGIQNEDLTQEGAAAEEGEMHIQNCSVVLNRLEERDGMNRKSGIPKPASRIPTFHKKTTTMEAVKPKTQEVKERFLSAPAVRSPFAFSSDVASTEATATTFITNIAVPKTLSESYLTASPRPALRPDQALNQQLPDESKTRLGSRSEEEEERKEEVAGERYAYENGERGEEEKAVWVRDGGQRGDGVSGDGESDGGEEERESEGEGITEEQPPWENKTLKLQAKEFVASSTDEEDEAPAAESEAQKIESLTPDEREEKDQDSQLAPIETEPGAPESEETPVLPTAEKTKKTWSYYSLLLRCLFPLLLLLLGGFSQHLWLYGLPHSVAQLSAQLHLHWLEGIVPKTAHCSSDCRASLVESLPVGLYPSAPAPHDSIAQSWLRLLDRANHSVDIAAFYLTLRSKDQEPTDAQGRLVFEKLKSLKAKGVTLRLSVNAPQSQTGDTDELEDKGAEVREVHMSSLTGGIIHTKLWAVDQRHLYVGSANMDWRSLTQVKEVGLTVEDCSCLSQDLSRVFEVYWTVGGANGSLPPYWPARLSALSSSQNPLHLKFNGVPARVYLSSSPPQLSTRGRTDDLAAILSVIEDAQYFIHVSVMDFLPLAQFSQPPRFWPPLDSALRAAACSRGLKIRLLVSCWPYSQAAMFVYLQSLLTLNRPPLNCDIQVKVFTVPSTMEQMKIQFARVNHAKFMVTDRVLYIGTSNWSEDYFTQTAGVGLVVNQTGSEPGLKTLRTQADQIFLRDWTSQYSTDLTTDQTDACPQAQR